MAAEAAWPGCGRMAWSSAAKTRSVAELGLHRHGRRDVRRTHQEGEVGQRQDQHPEHAVGAVDQREALLGRELDRRQTGRGQRLGGRHQRAVGVAHVALADQRQRAVRERREVAGAAERAVLVHHRRDARVEQTGHQLRHLRPYAGPAGRQRGQAQQHQPTHDLALHLRTGARCVRADQRALELRAHLGAGCAAWPGRRTRWRCRRPESELRRARPPRRVPSQWRQGLVAELDPNAVTRDRDAPPRRRAAPTPTCTVGERWWGCADSCDDSTSSGGPAASPASPVCLGSRDVDPTGGTMRTHHRRAALRRALPRSRLRRPARAGVQEGRPVPRPVAQPDRRPSPEQPTPPPPARRRRPAPRSRCRSCRSRGISGPSSAPTSAGRSAPRAWASRRSARTVSRCRSTPPAT